MACQSVLALHIPRSRRGTRRNNKWGALPGGFGFCGRHAGDQGSGRTDWAGPQPPLSPGALHFHHSAARESEGELHVPLVFLVALSLSISLSLALSLSVFISSSASVSSFAPCPQTTAHLLRLMYMLPLPLSPLLRAPLYDFVVHFQTAACMVFCLVFFPNLNIAT